MKYEITGHTKLIGLIGSPVEHSISPMMHNKAFELLGLDYAYLAFDVSKESLKEALAGVKAFQMRGCNVTMPHKNEACRFCDQLSLAAEIIGAVNTVVNDNGILRGYTTDGVGYMRAVREAGCEVVGKKMTLLGAGGAGMAILVQAALDGVAEIAVFNRRTPFFERAERVIGVLEEKTNCKIHLYDYEDAQILRREIAESVLLTNATSVGMAPNEDASIIEDPSMFHRELFVSDVIYNPKETKLLKMAREAGCETMNGLMMLLYQGAEAFRLWTGEDMPVSKIRELYFE